MKNKDINSSSLPFSLIIKLNVARSIIIWEGISKYLYRLILILLIFFIAILTEVFSYVNFWIHGILLILFFICFFIFSFNMICRMRWPSKIDCARRIENDNSIANMPFSSLFDKPMLNENSALLTLTYLGAVQSLPNYNVMGLAKASLEANTRFLAAAMGPDGIRVNAISAGPIKTLAASGVKNFRKMLTSYANRAPLRRAVTTIEVGNVAAFLCSDLASGVTGEITYVDAGFNTAAMSIEDYPD